MSFLRVLLDKYTHLKLNSVHTVQTSHAINSDSSLRLSVSESSEWVCTKTIFNNGSIVRGCKKTYTGISKYEHHNFQISPLFCPKNLSPDNTTTLY